MGVGVVPEDVAFASAAADPNRSASRLRERWEAVRVAVEGELRAFCAGATRTLVDIEPRARPLAESVTALTLAPGKRVRPLLVHYGNLLAGGVGLCPAEVRLAAAVEMLQTFALVQDDIIDGSRQRRGAPSTWARLGTAGAMLASDVALTWSEELIDSTVVAPEVIAAVRQQVRWLRLETVAGEFLDACVPGEDDRRHRDVLKTARYTATRPLLIGALLGPSVVDLAVLQEFGDGLGVCFQSRDDQLDGVAAGAAGDEAERAGRALDRLDGPADVSSELRVLLGWAAVRSS